MSQHLWLNQCNQWERFSIILVTLPSDIPLLPAMGAADKVGDPNFVVHWLNNKELHFTHESETLLEEMTQRSQVSSFHSAVKYFQAHLSFFSNLQEVCILLGFGGCDIL